MIGKILHLFKKKPVPVVLKPQANFKIDTPSGAFYYLGSSKGKSVIN
ncbi:MULTISPECIES: hypothetical protein [Acinetobacter]|nr:MULTISPECIES: hypothetical protein [Acinetobacter]MCH7382170.1 hypothetical protein [Acinetobacter higginsii]